MHCPRQRFSGRPCPPDILPVFELEPRSRLPSLVLAARRLHRCSGVSGALKSCQPGQPSFPECLSGVHLVQNVGGDDQSRFYHVPSGQVGSGQAGATAVRSGLAS